MATISKTLTIFKSDVIIPSGCGAQGWDGAWTEDEAIYHPLVLASCLEEAGWSRWHRHDAQGREVLGTETKTEITTNFMFPAGDLQGLIFQDIYCTVLVVFNAQPPVTSAPPKRGYITGDHQEKLIPKLPFHLTALWQEGKKLPNYKGELCFHGHQPSVICLASLQDCLAQAQLHAVTDRHFLLLWGA